MLQHYNLKKKHITELKLVWGAAAQTGGSPGGTRHPQSAGAPMG